MSEKDPDITQDFSELAGASMCSERAGGGQHRLGGGLCEANQRYSGMRHGEYGASEERAVGECGANAYCASILAERGTGG